MRAYGQSKLACLLFAFELQRHSEGRRLLRPRQAERNAWLSGVGEGSSASGRQNGCQTPLARVRGAHRSHFPISALAEILQDTTCTSPSSTRHTAG
jgi:hypothetical protein